jgi:Domain of unknown function (DUF4252)
MKLRNPFPVFALALGLAVSAQAQTDIEKNPAYLNIDKAIDTKVVRPAVNVNLPRFLLMDVASGFDGGPDDPFAGTGIDLKDLIKDIQLIRLVVIEDQAEHAKLVEKGINELRSQLKGKWTCIVDVPEENIGVYAISDSTGEAMAGVALLVNNDGDAVIGNIVGKVSIGKLVKAAGKLKGLPPGLMEKLGGLNGAAPANAETKPADTKPAEKKPEPAPAK